MNPPRIVILDTNVLLDLLLFVDPACAALAAALADGRLQAVCNDECAEEWRRVLGYRIWQLDSNRQQALRQAHAQLHRRSPATRTSEATDSHAHRLPRCRDPDDQKFLELAADAGAWALVSKDRDLLKLARRCARLGLFHILPPATFAAPNWPGVLQRSGRPAF
jgi:putative PIN family toxin of toxin-antitoxin system